MDLDSNDTVESVQQVAGTPPSASEGLEPIEHVKNDASDYLTPVESMKSLLLPANDDLETLVDVHHTWEIDDWKGLPERLHGPAFEAGGFRWRLLLFPEGNHTHSISVYLECGQLKDPLSDEEVEPEPTTEEIAGAEEATTQVENDEHVNGNENQNMEDSGDVDTEQHSLPADDVEEWSVCGQFGFVMWNPQDPSVYHSSVAQHRFTVDEHDWGFSNFYDLRRVFSKHQDRDRALIEDNKVNITTYLRIVKDETGVLWHNFVKYNSKKETGFVGLKNQGATCYLNSLLQSLYFTKQFRRVVYKIPTEDDKLDSVPAALQTLFYLLRTEEQPVGTLALTKSFGWDSGDAFTQHDVQELNRVLMDKLEGKMKGTSVEGALNNIFVAQMKSYVKCVNVDFESSRIEDYWDIQLNVKGMKTLEDSFNDYIQVEMLEGENQYQATGFGLQDAKKGVVFKSFPPVLHLQLKRYEYDFYRDMMIKINDRYEFPLEIDLSRYLEEGSDMSEPWVYELHGVLVHSGDLNAGHYYALLKPHKDGYWYKFDDDRVTRATMKEVLEDNFGGDLPMFGTPGTNGPRNPMRFNYKRHSSAYMLVYLRKSRLDQILPDEDDHVPLHIPRRIEEGRLEEQARRRERDQQHFFLTALVLSNRQFTKYHGLDVGQWEAPSRLNGSTAAIEDPDALPEAFRVRKTSPVGEFVEMLAQHYGVTDVSRLRLWSIIGRQNKTRRLDTIVGDLSETMEHVKMRCAPRGPEVRFWLEEVDDDGILSGVKPSTDGIAVENSKELLDTLIFFKYFDHRAQQIVGAGTLILDLNLRVCDVAKLVAEKMGWPSETQLNLYEEVTSEMVEYMDPRMTLQDCEINKGDIICFERALNSSEVESIEGYKNAKEFYDFLDQRLPLTFRPKSSSTIEGGRENDEGAFTAWISRKDTYDKMAELAANKLGVDPTHLQFYTTTSSGYHRTPIKRDGHTIQQMLAPPYLNQYANVTVFYEVLEVSLAELENKRNIVVSWLAEGLSQEHKYDLLLSKTATVSNLVSALVDKAKLEVGVKIKIWTAHDGHVLAILDGSEHISKIPEQCQVYAALLNGEEYDLLHTETPNPDKRLVRVFHFQKDPSRTHGIPCLFVIHRGEPFSQTKIRLQKVFGFYDKVFEKIKFAIVRRESYASPTYVEDADELFSEMGPSDELGLDHVDKTSRRGYGQQTAIFIKN